MNIKFEDVLEAVNITKVEIFRLEEKLNEAENSEDKLPIILEMVGLADEIGKYYYEKIFYDDYFLSVEDIAKNLNLSIRFVMNDIVEKLDRIEFPAEEFINIKRSMKNIIYLNLSDKTKKDKNIYTSTKYSYEFLKNKVKVLYRKKVLYSKESYIKFLKEHMELLESSTLIQLILEKEWVEKTKSRLLKDYKIKDKVFIGLLFDKFLEKNKIEIEKYKANEIFDFKSLLENRFENNEKRELSDFKSINSLKVFFDKVYEVEVLRAIENSNISFKFNLDLGGKKNIKRYILNSEFIVKKVKESLNYNKKNDDKKSENSFEVKIPTSYLLNQYNNNINLLIKDFKENTENIKKFLKRKKKDQ